MDALRKGTGTTDEDIERKKKERKDKEIIEDKDAAQENTGLPADVAVQPIPRYIQDIPAMSHARPPIAAPLTQFSAQQQKLERIITALEAQAATREVEFVITGDQKIIKITVDGSDPQDFVQIDKSTRTP